MGLGRTSARIARVCQLGPEMGHERFGRGFLTGEAENGQIKTNRNSYVPTKPRVDV